MRTIMPWRPLHHAFATPRTVDQMFETALGTKNNGFATHLDLRENDVGVVIAVTVDEDVSTATYCELIMVNRVGESKTVVASLSAPSTIEYTTQDGDFDTFGQWRAQVRIVQPGFDRRSAVFNIDVDQEL